MKTICFYFQVHQPLRLKRYRFFNMGKDHDYLDDATNRTTMKKMATTCYLPMNALLLELIDKHKGDFKVSLSISGLAVEQFRQFAPEVLTSFKKLAETGCVEFLSETYAHSLASLCCEEEFMEQVEAHSTMIESEFGQRPTAFCNTEMIYSDEIGSTVAKMGFKTMLAEGAKHVLGWKSPNYVYASAMSQNLRLMLRNYKLSDDIVFRFSDRSWQDWPLTAEKFLSWITPDDIAGDVTNIFMDYETFGKYQKAESGIFDFMRQLPTTALESKKVQFMTVSEASDAFQPISVLSCPHPMSWADEERDVTAWLGNVLQDEAFAKLYELRDKVKELDSPDFNYPWMFLQACDHFYYMATKWFFDGEVHKYLNPYSSSYEAFINYMNVLSDYMIELDKALDARHNKP